MGSLPRRRVDLFSSLRLRRSRESESKGKEVEKEPTTMFSNLRSKGENREKLFQGVVIHRWNDFSFRKKESKDGYKQIY